MQLTIFKKYFDSRRENCTLQRTNILTKFYTLQTEVGLAMNISIWVLVTLFFPYTVIAEQVRILVSVAPYVTMIDELTEGTIGIQLMVPPGMSGHSYEPTPKQIIQASNAAIWFCIGESFEPKAVEAIREHTPTLRVVDLRKGLSLIEGSHCHGSHYCNSSDTHIWLSPAMMIQQVKTIAQTLEQTFPESAAIVQKNLPNLVHKLEALNQLLREQLMHRTKNSILVAHPAYRYLCREVGITEQSIEKDGKEPTPKELIALVDQAKKEKITVIFVQNEYANKGAALIAQEIGARLVMLQPYDTHYFASMHEIIERFAQAVQ